ncbi:hypothetical protein [Aurantimonas sp. 22II-16-19i]|uniref:hypothetical protein n=1 Tax=Aurantimonas sp. 22II-16-19i TaxID=1317114 RepID=UPI0009F80142|nr:hypothetical protein [Aurantimonas sp. 22II-16-19i]ORE97301.1 hypothetical protein ATO4_09626 [Aurantimonas sp. 22II-16-19i]
MPRLTASTLLASGLLLVAGPASAMVKVTNETDSAWSVTFDHGTEENRHEVEPGATAQEACPNGCAVRFRGHDFVAVNGDELAIQAGVWRPVKTN